MPSRSVRIDEETDAIVAALAAFLHRSKQSVMREAVHALLDAERERIDASTIEFISRLSRETHAGSAALVELRALPLAQRLELQRHALRELFLAHRCSDVIAFDLDDADAGGRGSVRIVADFPPRMDAFDRDELRLKAAPLLDCLIEFVEAWRMRITDAEQFARLEREGIRLTPRS